MKAVKANVKFEKENNQNPLNTISIVYFPLARLFTYVFSRTSTIHPGIFRGQALFSRLAVSPRTNTIVSRDQFKPMRIGENLVMNYNGERGLGPKLVCAAVHVTAPAGAYCATFQKEAVIPS